MSKKVNPHYMYFTFQRKLRFRKKGIEKNLLAKQFIQKIIYSPENIKIALFYNENSENFSKKINPTRLLASRSSGQNPAKENQLKNSLSCENLLREQNSFKLFTITIPNLIHQSKKKNLR